MLNSLPILALALALSACKPGSGGDEGVPAQPIAEQDLPQVEAETICELVFQCSCEDPKYADEPTCLDTRSSEFEDAQLVAQAAGLTYDAQCAGNAVAVAESIGCSSDLSGPLDCSSFCAIYYGDVAVDEPCTVHDRWSDCAQGLSCLGGVCQDPCGSTNGFLGVGEACSTPEGELLGLCDGEAGLICDSATSVCVALPSVGEPCYQSEVCGVGATCDWSGDEAICVALPGAGEACTYACAEGLYCDGVDGVDGTCNPLPGVGEPCSPNQNCSEDAICDDAAVCQPLPALACYL